MWNAEDNIPIPVSEPESKFEEEQIIKKVIESK